MAKSNETKRPTEAEVKAAVERMNKEAGYDVPVAFAAMKTMIIQEQARMAMPGWKTKVGTATAVDVVVRAHGGQMTADGVSMLMDYAMVCGWLWATEEQGMFGNKGLENDLMAYIERDTTHTVEQNLQRKEGLLRGLRAIAEACKVVESKLKIVKQVKG